MGLCLYIYNFFKCKMVNTFFVYLGKSSGVMELLWAELAMWSRSLSSTGFGSTGWDRWCPFVIVDTFSSISTEEVIIKFDIRRSDFSNFFTVSEFSIFDCPFSVWLQCSILLEFCETWICCCCCCCCCCCEWLFIENVVDRRASFSSIDFVEFPTASMSDWISLSKCLMSIKLSEFCFVSSKFLSEGEREGGLLLLHTELSSSSVA